MSKTKHWKKWNNSKVLRGKVRKLNSISSQTNQLRMYFLDIPDFRIFFTHTLLMKNLLKKVIQQIGKGTEERE